MHWIIHSVGGLFGIIQTLELTIVQHSSTGQDRKVLIHSPWWSTHWSHIHRWRERFQSRGSPSPNTTSNRKLAKLYVIISQCQLNVSFVSISACWNPTCFGVSRFITTSSWKPRKKILDCYLYVNFILFSAAQNVKEPTKHVCSS